jgi:hypothetical protein
MFNHSCAPNSETGDVLPQPWTQRAPRLAPCMGSRHHLPCCHSAPRPSLTHPSPPLSPSLPLLLRSSPAVNFVVGSSMVVRAVQVWPRLPLSSHISAGPAPERRLLRTAPRASRALSTAAPPRAWCEPPGSRPLPTGCRKPLGLSRAGSVCARASTAPPRASLAPAARSTPT